MDSAIAQLGIGGIFAILLIHSFIAMLKTMKNGKTPNGTNPQTCQDIKKITIDTNDKVKKLDSLHSKTDQDGLPVWYFPRSLVKSQEEIAKAQADTTMHMKSLAESVRKIEETQRR